MKTVPILLTSLLFITLVTGPASATKPVRQQWEDLISIAGSQHGGANGVFRIYVIQNPNRPCDNSARNKFKVRFVKYEGKRAFDWLKSRGMAAYSNGRWRKTENYKYWEMSRQSGSLYWQRCASQSGGSGGSCGRRLSDQERRRFWDWLKKFQETRWSTTRVNTADHYHALRDEIINANYGHIHYQVNVNIWTKKVECFDHCIMATPRNIQVNKTAYATYRRCIKQCNKTYRYKKCP